LTKKDPDNSDVMTDAGGADATSGISAAPAASTASNDSKERVDQQSYLENLNKETGVLAWNELVRFFARGVVIKVEAELDLVDVGRIVATDDTGQLKTWIDAELVARASDDDARRWTELDPEPEFWCLVTAPWVLVQERDIAQETRSGLTLH